MNSELDENLDGRGETILVIEDEEILAEISKISLELHGYTIVTARHGVEGIEIFKRNPHAFKAVICDLNLPHLDGSSTLLALLSIKPEIHIIMVSGSVDPDNIPKLPKFASWKYLQKPYKIATLLTTLSQLFIAERSIPQV